MNEFFETGKKLVGGVIGSLAGLYDIVTSYLGANTPESLIAATLLENLSKELLKNNSQVHLIDYKADGTISKRLVSNSQLNNFLITEKLKIMNETSFEFLNPIKNAINQFAQTSNVELKNLTPEALNFIAVTLVNNLITPIKNASVKASVNGLIAPYKLQDDIKGAAAVFNRNESPYIGFFTLPLEPFKEANLLNILNEKLDLNQLSAMQSPDPR